MADNSIQLDSGGSYLFVGNSYTFGRVDPVMSYNSDNVRDLTAPVPGTTFENTSGTNPYEPHPWGGVPGLFEAFADQAGLELDVAISARNAATLQGQYLNSNPAGWDLRGNVASQAWDVVVLQENSTQALPSGAGSITFAAGSSTATLTIHPTADTTVEIDETIGLQITPDATYRTSAGVVSGTILNDDPTGPVVNPALPTVTLVASPGAVLEDGTDKLVYTFTRTGPTTSAMTVNFTAFRDGSTAPSVASGGDFENNANQFTNSFQADTGAATTGNVSFTSNTGSVVIPAGASSVTFTLDPRPDATMENDESIRLTLSANANYNVGTQGAVSVTILNDDFAAGTDLSLPNISLNLAASAVYEDGSGDLVYVFTRTGSNTAPLTVKFGVSGTATLPGNDFTVTGADSFTTPGAANPNLQSFNTYAVKLAQYAMTGAADGAIPANAHANAATDVYLYETWARPNMVTGAIVATTDDTTGAVTNTTTTAPEYYQSLEAMTADLRAAYEGLAAANPIFAGVAPVGAAFLAAVQNGTATRNPYAPDAGTDGKVDLWWDDNLHASKYGSYLSGLTLFGTLTGLDPRSLGAAEHVAADLGITQAEAAALQNVAAATLGFTLDAHWTAPGQVTELQGGVTGSLATAGSFGFADSDTADTHTITVAPLTPDSIGTFTATLHADTTGDGTGGAVNWQYTVDNAAVALLAPGATRVEHFLVTISDANGGLAQRDIAVTINGTYNDAPVNTMPAGALSTPGGVDYAIVGLSVSDVDSAQLTTTLHVDHGTLTVAAVGGVTVSGTGTGTVLLTGSAAQIDAALGAANSVIYHGALDFDGTDLLSMTSDDGGGAGGGSANTVAIDVSNQSGLFTAGDDTVTLPGAGSYVALGGNDTITMLATGETAYGGLGNDTYHVEATGNTVVELAGEGNDTVVTALLASYTLGANVENLIHTGHGDFASIGNQLNNLLIGGDGNNYLIGLDGNDTLISNGGLTALQGGAGDDIYAVQYVTDSVLEFGNEGTDQVQTFLSTYHLGPNVENLTFVGSAAHTGIGNELNNVLTGGDGNNYLIGLDGNDTLISNGLTALQGGAGDDIYAVQYVTDSVFEFANEGTDQVQTFLSSYTLSPNVENLTFVGAFSHNGVGNELANTFTGSSASDTFTGAGGNDVFNYRVSGNGLDIITDFNADNANAAEHDHIDLTGRGLNFAALAITTNADGITIGIPGGDALHLKGVAAQSLDAGDFFF